MVDGFLTVIPAQAGIHLLPLVTQRIEAIVAESYLDD